METIMTIWEMLPLVFALILGASLVICLACCSKFEYDQMKYSKLNRKRTKDYESLIK